MNDTLSHDDVSHDPAPAADIAPAGLASNDRTLAAAGHLAALVAALATSWFAGIAGAAAALVVWLLVRNSSSFAAAHAKEALNFQITVLIGYVICWILAFVIIGAFLTPLLWLFNLVFCIIAAIRVSSDGSLVNSQPPNTATASPNSSTRARPRMAPRNSNR